LTALKENLLLDRRPRLPFVTHGQTLLNFPSRKREFCSGAKLPAWLSIFIEFTIFQEDCFYLEPQTVPLCSAVA
jgi:hypothetical protein